MRTLGCQSRASGPVEYGAQVNLGTACRFMSGPKATAVGTNAISIWSWMALQKSAQRWLRVLASWSGHISMYIISTRINECRPLRTGWLASRKLSSGEKHWPCFANKKHRRRNIQGTGVLSPDTKTSLIPRIFYRGETLGGLTCAMRRHAISDKLLSVKAPRELLSRQPHGGVLIRSAFRFIKSAVS